jgi:hypothetical protein
VRTRLKDDTSQRVSFACLYWHRSAWTTWRWHKSQTQLSHLLTSHASTAQCFWLSLSHDRLIGAGGGLWATACIRPSIGVNASGWSIRNWMPGIKDGTKCHNCPMMALGTLGFQSMAANWTFFLLLSDHFSLVGGKILIKKKKRAFWFCLFQFVYVT